jgi:hypothetical protein
MVSEKVLLVKNKRTRILEKISPNPLDPGPEIWDPEKIHTGSGSQG